MATKIYTPAPAGARETRGPTRRWPVLAVASVAQLMVVLDVTVVNIALPSAQRALAFADAVGLLLGGLLTEYLNWRWTLYINLAFAAIGLTGAAAFLRRPDRPAHRPTLDLPGTVLVSAGLFLLVFGLSRAQAGGWHAPASWLSLTGAAALLAAFAGWQARAAAPLLPLRVLADRDRAASIIALTLASAGIYSVFLFLTYYLQAVQAYTPVRTGLAFLPMVATTIAGSVLGANVLLTRIGPRPTLPLGMLTSAAGMAWLTRLTVTSSYPAAMLGPLLILGLGLGLIFAPAISLGTARLRGQDTGVGSALVNTTQQVGGAVGIALLSTLAASAATSYLRPHAAITPALP